MRFFTACFAYIVSHVLMVTSGRALLTPIPHELPYLDSNTANLGHTPFHIDNEAVAHLLDIMENYGLTKNFGITRLHTHFDHIDGEVLFETGDNLHTKTMLRNFTDIENNAAPYTYRVDLTPTEPQLIPLEYGPINDNVKASRLVLAHAIDKGFLNEFYAALASVSGKNVGIGLITDINLNALAKGMLVISKETHNHSMKEAYIYPIEPKHYTATFYARSVDSDGFKVIVMCDCCEIGDPFCCP